MLSVGRLEDLKNYENIILAIKDLLNKGIYIKYIIFGKGYLDQKLRSLVQSHNLENNILLIGMVPNVYNYYKYFKYFIIASIHEGYPNSLIEAMDNELTAFGTDCGDTFEIIDNNRGIKIDGFDSKDIKNTLMNYFSNKKMQSAVSLNANKYVKFELSDEVIFSKWLNLL
jgi:glycosyltransferase involved in cell wall biosynthesis